jgi:hypothetical protein
MVRARLWYGPAGHGVDLERVAHYLRGPLACDLEMRVRPHLGHWVDQIEIRTPLPVGVEMLRTPDISGEAEDLVRRLPTDAPPALARRLAACTARLDFRDVANARPFHPAAGIARSILTPLAFAMDGIVEEVGAGRLRFEPLPEPERGYGVFLRRLAQMLEAIRRR